MIKRRYPETPLLGVGGIIFEDERVLLVKRGRAPGLGQWSIPGGLVELGERVDQALMREIDEETGLKIQVGPLVEVAQRIDWDAEGGVKYHYVVLDYLCHSLSGQPRHGADAAAVGWFDLEGLNSLDLNPKTRDVIFEAAQMAASIDFAVGRQTLL